MAQNIKIASLINNIEEGIVPMVQKVLGVRVVYKSSFTVLTDMLLIIFFVMLLFGMVLERSWWLVVGYRLDSIVIVSVITCYHSSMFTYT